MTPDSRQSVRTSPEEQQTESTEEGTCPECGGDLIHDEAGAETTCSQCGLVVDEEEIDLGPEWRAFTQKEKDEKSRVGAPTTQTRHDKGLTTTIGWQDKDAHGNTLSSEKRSHMQRLRKWHQRVRTKNVGERNLQFAFTEIERMASALGIPDSICEVSSVIYRRALDEDLIRGRSIEGVATASLYAACRQDGIPRSLDEMTTVSRIDKVELGRTYRYIAHELNLEMKPVDPKKYVPRFCSDLNMSDEVEIQANEIIDAIAEDGLLSGRSPTGVAGAAIYLASMLCGEKRTQRDVADIADVTEVTIRNRYQEQAEAMDEIDS